MKKSALFLTVLALALSFSIAVAAPQPGQTQSQPHQQQQSGSFLGELINFTSSLSSFFGSAINTMTQAIGYLTGGVEAANLYQQGTNVINDMLVNGPKPPAAAAPQAPKLDDMTAQDGSNEAPASLPAASSAEGSAPATSNENAQETLFTPQNVSDKDFGNMLKTYKSLAAEEKNVLNQMNENPDDAALKDIYQQIQTTKLEKSSKIIASLNYDIEKKQFSKLNLLIDYINVSGPTTLKMFAQIVDSARGKLQFTLIEAQKYGLTMDIQIIEGKLKLVMNLTTGNFTPSAPPASQPLPESTSAPASPAAASGGNHHQQPAPANESTSIDFSDGSNNSINTPTDSPDQTADKTAAKTKKTKKSHK
ncbi:MAG: hypothetical protein QMC67_09125 [Candidatus Wallbacteria bacterium]